MIGARPFLFGALAALLAAACAESAVTRFPPECVQSSDCGPGAICVEGSLRCTAVSVGPERFRIEVQRELPIGGGTFPEIFVAEVQAGDPLRVELPADAPVFGRICRRGGPECPRGFLDGEVVVVDEDPVLAGLPLARVQLHAFGGEGIPNGGSGFLVKLVRGRPYTLHFYPARLDLPPVYLPIAWGSQPGDPEVVSAFPEAGLWDCAGRPAAQLCGVRLCLRDPAGNPLASARARLLDRDGREISGTAATDSAGCAFLCARTPDLAPPPHTLRVRGVPGVPGGFFEATVPVGCDLGTLEVPVRPSSRLLLRFARSRDDDRGIPGVRIVAIRRRAEPPGDPGAADLRPAGAAAGRLRPVRLKQIRTGLTDSAGELELDRLQPGEYLVVAVPPPGKDCGSRSRIVHDVGEQAVTVLGLHCFDRVELRGSVLGPGGAPLAGASVIDRTPVVPLADLPDGHGGAVRIPRTAAAQTDAEGRFSGLFLEPGGVHRLQIAPPDPTRLHPVVVSIAVPPGDVLVPLDVQLHWPAMRAVRVVTADGQGVEGATVRLVWEEPGAPGGSLQVVGRTDASGVAQIPLPSPSPITELEPRQGVR